MNITQLVYQNAIRFPQKKAVVAPVSYDACGRICYSHYTYEQFVSESKNLSSRLQELKINKGSKVLLFVKPSLEFSLLVFSLFSIGAIPILIDPGIGRKNLLAAIKKVKPSVLIGEPIVHWFKKFFPGSFSTVELSITTKKASFLTSRVSLTQILKKGVQFPVSQPLSEIEANQTAAIVYTSGATGAPKGVVYTHGMFFQQVQLLRKVLPRFEEEVDLSCFPLFSLFAIAMGMTSVIPWLDAAKPASADPKLLLRHIQDQGVSLGTGSPAIWQRLANHCIDNKVEIPGLRAVMMFGAPVSLKLHEQLSKVLPNGTTYTPYGATECLPVSWISGEDILEKYAERMRSGEGTCVGLSVPETSIRILDDCEELPPFEVGEIVVSGLQATEEYFEDEGASKKSKIYEEGRFWHRMGDLGYKDNEGLLWFCGRKVHKVQALKETFYPINCEAIFNHHPLVKRSALIRLSEGNSSRPAIVIERADKKTDLSEKEKNFLRSGLLALARAFEHTKTIDTFFLYKEFPVDCRHNIKIDRIFLSNYFECRRESRI